MMKDVQRSFVLLRQCGNGRESGYARAETCEGRVKLNLVVQGFSPQDEAYAFGAAQDGVLLIGLLNLDGRGQGGIAAELSAQEMRSLQVLFVAVLRGGGADIPLAGTVGRGGWVDWTQVRALVAEALQPEREEARPEPEPPAQEETPCEEEAPAAEEETPCEEEMPIEEEPPAVEDEAPCGEEPVLAEEPPAVEEEAPCVEKMPLVEEEPPAVEEEASCEVEPIIEEEPAAVEEPSVEEEPSAEEEDFFDLPAQEDPFEAVERSLRTPLPKELRRELPEALRNAYWPQQLWPLHDLFERFEQAKPFGGEDAVYVRVPLGGKWGRIDHYLVGASVKDGWVTGVGYLIPGQKDAPPAGLAGYEWQDGYWQAWQYVDNGE